MINIENAYNEFDKYVSNYNPHHPRIKLKIEHIKRVAKNSEKIAKSLNLSNEEIQLAELIGLFHDIGRFEQVKIADTFSDKDSGINHAELSCKVLFEDNIIKNFIEENKYNNLIKIAIMNHNKAKIDNNLSEKELLFSKIIRDADKIDILFTIISFDFEPLFWFKTFDQNEINPIIVNQIEKHELINYSLIKNNADQIPIFYAYIFDLYFENSFKNVLENKYLDIYTERVKKHFKSQKIHEQVDYILNITNNYLKEKTKHYYSK